MYVEGGALNGPLPSIRMSAFLAEASQYVSRDLTPLKAWIYGTEYSGASGSGKARRVSDRM